MNAAKEGHNQNLDLVSLYDLYRIQASLRRKARLTARQWDCQRRGLDAGFACSVHPVLMATARQLLHHPQHLSLNTCNQRMRPVCTTHQKQLSFDFGQTDQDAAI